MRDCSQIEDNFIAGRRRAAGLHAALDIGLGLVGPIAGAPEGAPLVACARNVADAIEAAAAFRNEPAYHNRHHMAEATQAMAVLCHRAIMDGILAPIDMLVGLTAMVGHDMHHDGSCPRPGVLEARSRAAVEGMARAAGVTETLIEVLGGLVSATDPTRVTATARQAGRPGHQHATLWQLANEADVCASILPRLGLMLGDLLATEWRAAGRPDLVGAGVATARLAFLRSYPPFSPTSQAIGLDQARRTSIAALARAGAMAGADGTADAGCAALDAMPDSEAIALYSRVVNGRSFAS